MSAAHETEQERQAPRTSVFDFMEKVRMPALWLCVFVMAGFGVIALFGDLFQKTHTVPEEEIGSYQVPGRERVTLTNHTFYEESQRVVSTLHRMFSRGRGDDAQLGSTLLKVTVRDEEELAWAWFMLRDAARAAGILITDDIVIAGNKKAGGEELTLREYERRVPEADRALRRDLMAIARFRDAIDRAMPEPTFEALYERFKTTYEELHGSFVLFDTQKTDIAIDPKNNEDDRKKLEAWLGENPGVRDRKKIPEELDAKVLYARFRDETTEKLVEHYGARWAPLVAELKLEVSDEKLRKQFELYRTAYEVPLRIASEAFEKSLESRPESKPVDRPSEFELVKERLRIEYFATRLVEKAFEEVTRADKPLSPEEAMTKYGLRLAEVSHIDSLRIQQHPDFGSPRAAMAMLSGLREKSLKPGDFYNYKGDPSLATGAVEEPGGSVAIWMLTGYHPERPATLNDPGVTDFFVDEYKKKKRQDLAKEEAETFRKAVEERVTAAVAPKITELEALMTQEVERQLKEFKLDRNDAEHKPRILEIENAERVKKDEKVDAERAAVEPNMFLAVANEKFLPVRDTGWFSKTSNRNATFAASETITTSEKADQFFRKVARRTALAALKPGRMGQVEVEPNWYAAAVPLLVAKREPKPEDLYKISKSQLDQLKSQVAPKPQSAQFWTYDNFKRPEWFKLNVPQIDKGLEAKRLADQKRAEQERVRGEKKKQQGKVRAERLADDAMQSRPLFSGEDW